LTQPGYHNQLKSLNSFRARLLAPGAGGIVVSRKFHHERLVGAHGNVSGANGVQDINESQIATGEPRRISQIWIRL
jgi:hypothetical protein